METPFDAWIETAVPHMLPEFLPAQRWFGGKSRSIQRVEFEDAAWVPQAHQPTALVIVRVGYADLTRERYAMLLGFFDDLPQLPVVGRLEPPGSALWVVEASADADSALALLRGFAAPHPLHTLRGGQLRFGDAGEAAARALAGAARSSVRPVGHEQSNTSLRFDRTLVFKLFRKLDEGENPELELGRFLTTRTTFRAMPGMQGSLTYVPARGGASTVGVLQDWVENRGDGWGYLIGQLREPPSGPEGRDPLRQEIAALGATTAEFHAALATDAGAPDFTPEPVTAGDVAAWEASLLERTSGTFALVERNFRGWPEDARSLGESLLTLRGHAAALAAAPPLAKGGFKKIRVHGDYHLGQTLKTAGGFVLIDFEGEPARPLAERRLKQCALKDVAGMIRSFDYAVETALRHRPDAADVPAAGRLREWFLDGYLSAAADRAPFLPKDRGALDAWIEFFEIEKALYEVEYEINNRPAWVHLPLRGVLGILRARA